MKKKNEYSVPTEQKDPDWSLRIHDPLPPAIPRGSYSPVPRWKILGNTFSVTPKPERGLLSLS